jgi:hypothetical protein
VLEAVALVDDVVAAGALVVDLLLEPQALTTRATIGTAASKKNRLTINAPFSIDVKDNTTLTGRTRGRERIFPSGRSLGCRSLIRSPCFTARMTLPRRRGLAALTPMAIVLALAGCGGNATHKVIAAPAGPYRWLVETAGSQPSVAQENRSPGTNAWRMPGPAAVVGGLAHGNVSGYVAQQAIQPGQTERVYVSAPGAFSVRVRVFRIGWYRGAGGREILASQSLPVAQQPPCRHRFETGLTECRWHPTLSFQIPSALASGVYTVRLTASTGESDCLFVVEASRPQPLLAQLPTSTYEAYNSWGGDSLYPGGADRVSITGTSQGVEVSYDRPYDSNTGAGQFFSRDVAMVRFLERYGYPVSYTASESVDRDPGQVTGHRALIDFGHSEYWSAGQEQAFARAFSAGESLLFFASDTLAWRVRYRPATAASSESGHPGHVIVSYKEHASLDPDRAETTGPFPGGGAPLTGSAYLGCITPRLSLPGPPTYRYYSWSPASGLTPSWLFAGTGITASTSIPGIVGYELDRTTSLTPAGTQVVGSGSAPCMSAAPGEPIPGPGDDVTQSTLYSGQSGAIVFDSGTLGWELGLDPVPSASPDVPRVPDARVVAMTRNLLAHALGGAA